MILENEGYENSYKAMREKMVDIVLYSRYNKLTRDEIEAMTDSELIDEVYMTGFAMGES